jgi:hypothetical protein
MHKSQIPIFNRFAREMLDGPLLHKAYVIPLLFETTERSVSDWPSQIKIKWDHVKNMIIQQNYCSYTGYAS